MTSLLRAGLATAMMGALATPALAADYKIDTEGQHAFVQFKVQHLGYSWLLGQFNDFDGHFSFDPDNVKDASVEVTVNTDSLDTNHAERDKHLKGKDFLNASEYPTAKFVSTGYTPDEDNKFEGELKGNLTLHGVTKPVTFDVDRIGGGDDPWGGYRQGFEAEATIQPNDFGIDMSSLGDASKDVTLYVTFEGIRQ
ncbi:YceI family protein [Larsenimonas suaedae]|uniref:YceI family protein n=1 Tax=Larsenimonas suaedae TaxID=1851019 RepID=A0ABU1GRW0_9GAMM|nr:YceI family protein [Larsenimonas suaedae]MCM2972449.1 YceI family protein [Larsenimonas suaedae]MDR5894755.1 YceI family protein [Larsenimonas suaedae]